MYGACVGQIGLQEVGFGGMDWIDLVQGRGGWRELANLLMNCRFPKNVAIF